jgi:hypothetical protein
MLFDNIDMGTTVGAGLLNLPAASGRLREAVASSASASKSLT